MNEIKEKFNNVIDSGGINEIYIGPEEEAPEEAKIIIDSNQMKTPTNLIAENLDGNETDKAPCVQAVNNGLENIRGKILWTNPNSAENISADYEMNLSSDNYDLIEVIYQYSTSGVQQTSSKAVKGTPISLQAYSIGSNMTILVRRMDYVNDTKYKLSACSLHQVTGNNVNTENTSGIIPLYVIGYKTGLFNEGVNE